MNNFSFLNEYPAFGSFAPAAAAAEQILCIDCAACALNCRRAMESAVRWMYAADDTLEDPGDDALVTMMSRADFADIVGTDILRRMDYVRRVGNQAAHDGAPVTREMAMLCLENLFIFLDFIAYCYAGDSREHTFDPSLVPQAMAAAGLPAAPADAPDVPVQDQSVRASLTANRQKKQPGYTPHPLKLSEYQTRKLYVDAMLTDAGWIEGADWEDEHYVGRLPDGSTDAMIDYVLWGSDKKPLALIEARRTADQVGQGRKRAKLCADWLEEQYGRRPVIFLTNGFETRIIDGESPERTVSGIWSKSDLTRLFNIRKKRQKTKNVSVDKSIAGRAYQKSAVRALCAALTTQKRRRALMTMAPGAGKTRTVLALIDVLRRYGWAQRILFLSDRASLVTQAARVMKQLLPGVSQADLSAGSRNYTAKCLLSTYDTLCGVVDTAYSGTARTFTAGHFDLVICDEVHSALLGRYRDVITYFDAPVVGMTSTPADEIGKDVYAFFDLKKCVPTYSYGLSEAVRDGFLVEYTVEETGEDLSERLDDEDVIRRVLDALMKNGRRINFKKYGSVPGKTIIFAASPAHAAHVADVFRRAYPQYRDLCAVIDADSPDAQKLLDRFARADSLPLVAVSADALDEGVDVPSVLNLVFFRPVRSKAHFWQMIGRGTRLCPGLIDGQDKTGFSVFDWCGSFAAFRMTGGRRVLRLSWPGACFRELMLLCTRIGLPDSLRASIVSEAAAAARTLDRDSFAVRQHLASVEQCADESTYDDLTPERAAALIRDTAPLFVQDPTRVASDRCDALMLRLMRAALDKDKPRRASMAAAACAMTADVPDSPDPASLAAADLAAVNDLRLRLCGLVRRSGTAADPALDRELLTIEFV